MNVPCSCLDKNNNIKTMNTKNLRIVFLTESIMRETSIIATNKNKLDPLDKIPKIERKKTPQIVKSHFPTIILHLIYTFVILFFL